MISPINIQPVIYTSDITSTRITNQSVTTENMLSNNVVTTMSANEDASARNDDALAHNKDSVSVSTSAHKTTNQNAIHSDIRVNVGYDDKTGIFTVALQDITTNEIITQLPSKEFIHTLETKRESHLPISS